MNRLEALGPALEWLRDVAEELADVPEVLHTHDVQPSDLLGSPKMSGGFYAHLTGSPYETREVRREVVCPNEHPIRHQGEAPCPICADALGWLTTTDVYVRPLAAAMDSLGRVRSRLRPHPSVVIRTLLRSGGRPSVAGLVLGFDSEDRRFLSAIRALYDQYSVTAIAPARRPVAAA